MAEVKNGGWNKFLVGCIWGIVIAFAGTCIGGYLTLDEKIARADERRQENTMKLTRMEECLASVKEDLKEIKMLTLKIYNQR